MLQCEEENIDCINLWNCIINAIAYIARKAYEKEGINFFPEPILLVDDEIIKESIESLIQYNCEEKEFIQKIYQEYIKEY